MYGRVDEHRWVSTPGEPVGFRHDRVSQQVISYLENYVFKRRIGERRNYVMIPGMDSVRKRPFPPVGP
jgi:hypothetical protein